MEPAVGWALTWNDIGTVKNRKKTDKAGRRTTKRVLGLFRKVKAGSKSHRRLKQWVLFKLHWGAIGVFLRRISWCQSDSFDLRLGKSCREQHRSS